MRNRQTLNRSFNYCLALVAWLLCFGCSGRQSQPPPPSLAPAQIVKAGAPAWPAWLDQISDEDWRQRAIAALGDREGAVIIIDPQTGRLCATVNPRIAFEQAYPPGSAIKPFTALAAMRAGWLDRESKHQCQTRYTRPDFEILCSHPRSKAPFNLPQALGYSCNDYFAHVGEQLSEGAFNATLDSFGFGRKTGAGAGEAQGSVPSGAWHVRVALGESDQLLVTPIQLMMAYTALVNGGRLYGAETLATRLQIAPEHRATLIEGMRGSVKYGTAASAKLDELPSYVFGKTGTSTASNGFRTQGWFVAFVADKAPVGPPLPEQIKLGLLVFLRRSHGSECAQVAKEILGRRSDRTTGQRGNGATDFKLQTLDPRSPSIKVRSVSENVVRELPLETYLAGVLAAESSVEDEPEALKAQAVVSRTFALKNLGRHARDGYDFCSTTHCQRFAATTPYRRALMAVDATTGETLLDVDGKVVDAYFHAACGGATANIETLWGAGGASYLRGVRDDFCVSGPHRRWTQTIPADQLLKAAQSDERTNTGARLNSVIINKRDATGRVESITLVGETRRTVRGWDFKIIVGRALGWQMIKSSRFDVERQGGEFVFRGSGFGHGLGLCQEGAHAAAGRDLRYSQILQFYFPGTRLSSQHRTGRGSDRVAVMKRPLRLQPIATSPSSVPASLNNEDVIWQPASFIVRQDAERTYRSQHFSLTCRPLVAEREVQPVLRLLEGVRGDLLARLRQASMSFDQMAAAAAPVEVFIHATTEDFIAATGQSGWAAAATRGSRIELQPLGLLKRRGILTTTLRHELAHAVVELLSHGRAPRWLSEGLAIHFADEGPAMAQIQIKEKISRDELESRLAHNAPAQEMRQLYALAYKEVRALIATEGETALWRRAAKYKR